MYIQLVDYNIQVSRIRIPVLSFLSKLRSVVLVIMIKAVLGLPELLTSPTSYFPAWDWQYWHIIVEGGLMLPGEYLNLRNAMYHEVGIGNSEQTNKFRR